MTGVNRRRAMSRPLAIGVGLFVAAAAAMTYFFFFDWSSVREASEEEARRILASAVDEAGGDAPYIVIDETGVVTVNRDQEHDEPVGFGTLRLMAWLPEEERVLTLDYPHWFVRLKTMSSLNLGTMIAAALRDWEQLDLSVSYDDLRRRGPGLLLDHRQAGGVRIVLWSTSKSGGRPSIRDAS